MPKATLAALAKDKAKLRAVLLYHVAKGKLAAAKDRLMRIAVVGIGVSGLVTAHLLHPTHDVTVFEANDYAGGHTNTVRVDTPNETHHVDTGFIVFNDRNYPNFERLLERLGVRAQSSTMSFSVSDGSGGFEYNSASPNGLFAKRAHLLTPWFHRMVADLARFDNGAPGGNCSRSPTTSSPTTGAERHRYGAGADEGPG